MASLVKLHSASRADNALKNARSIWTYLLYLRSLQKNLKARIWKPGKRLQEKSSGKIRG
jgi:hypothetical protein